MIVKIDGAKIRSVDDLHQCLKDGLLLGNYYGNNLAALRDRLTTDVERPVHIIWKNSEQSRVAMGEEMFSKFVKLFVEVAEQDERYGWDERFTFTCE